MNEVKLYALLRERTVIILALFSSPPLMPKNNKIIETIRKTKKINSSVKELINVIPFLYVFILIYSNLSEQTKLLRVSEDVCRSVWLAETNLSSRFKAFQT